MQKHLQIPKLPTLPLATSIIIFIALVAAAALAYVFTPRLTEVSNAPNLETTVPKKFGDWREVPSPYLQVSLTTGLDPNMDQPYDQVVMRTYINSNGQQVMLALAWGKRQRQEVKIHRPDLCYVAQGYQIANLAPANFTSIGESGSVVKGKHMTALNGKGGEAVAYWIRIGNLYSENALESRSHIFREGLKGKVPDGILVRASSRIRSEKDAIAQFPLLEQFLIDLYKASPTEVQAMMVRV
ncbi:EpsI_fam, EpsI family protein [Comamonadaceae bacterium]